MVNITNESHQQNYFIFIGFLSQAIKLFMDCKANPVSLSTVLQLCEKKIREERAPRKQSQKGFPRQPGIYKPDGIAG